MSKMLAVEKKKVAEPAKGKGDMGNKTKWKSLLLLEGLLFIAFIIVEMISNWLNFDIGFTAVVILLPCAILILLYHVFIKKHSSRENKAKMVKHSLDRLQDKKAD